jgi:hypothetical protein
MDEARLRHIWIEVASGRGRHGDFLKSFGDAYSRADYGNIAILHDAAVKLVLKYGLENYLDNFEEE